MTGSQQFCGTLRYSTATDMPAVASKRSATWKPSAEARRLYTLACSSDRLPPVRSLTPEWMSTRGSARLTCSDRAVGSDTSGEERGGRGAEVAEAATTAA